MLQRRAGRVILLLLVGTQIFSWRGCWLLPVATLASGLTRPGGACRRHTKWRNTWIDPEISGYAVDGAIFRAPSDPIRPIGRAQYQLEQAERLAEPGSAPRHPTHPRAAYLTAALGLIASSLFALRYGLDRRLDLQAAARPHRAGKLGSGSRKPTAKNMRKKPLRRAPESPRDIGAPRRTARTSKDAEPDAAWTRVGEPETDSRQESPNQGCRVQAGRRAKKGG